MAIVTAAGFALVVMLLPAAARSARSAPAALWMLAALVAVSQLAPISMPRWKSYYVTTSIPFAMPILGIWGLAPAVIALAVSSLVGDLVHRRSAAKTAFNAGQYALSFAAGGALYLLLSGGGPFELSSGRVLAYFTAGVVFSASNISFVLIVLSLIQRRSVLREVAGPVLRYEAWSWPVRFGMGLVVLLVTQRVPAVVPFLGLPLVPIYAAIRAAKGEDRRRAEAETARHETEAARVEADVARVQAEVARAEAEVAQFEAERARIEAERAGAEAEVARVEAEKARAEAEAGRAAAEQVAEERAHLIDARNGLIQRMQEVDRHKDELLAAVTHELRTPASSILSVARTLAQRGDHFSAPERQQFLELVLEQAEQLDQLISQLLLAAKLQQPQFVADPATRELVDAEALLRRAAELATLTHPDRHITVEANGTLPVLADRRVLGQILGNLVGNAAKHTPAGTPIWLEASRRGTLAVLAVEDQGAGVPPSQRGQVFERFTQLDGSSGPGGGGVGLGLYIARQLARAQGGEVLAIDPTRQGGGARFELRLPLVGSGNGGAHVAGTSSARP